MYLIALGFFNMAIFCISSVCYYFIRYPIILQSCLHAIAIAFGSFVHGVGLSFLLSYSLALINRIISGPPTSTASCCNYGSGEGMQIIDCGSFLIAVIIVSRSGNGIKPSDNGNSLTSSNCFSNSIFRILRGLEGLYNLISGITMFLMEFRISTFLIFKALRLAM